MADLRECTEELGYRRRRDPRAERQRRLQRAARSPPTRSPSSSTRPTAMLRLRDPGHRSHRRAAREVVADNPLAAVADQPVAPARLLPRQAGRRGRAWPASTPMSSRPRRGLCGPRDARLDARRDPGQSRARQAPDDQTPRNPRDGAYVAGRRQAARAGRNRWQLNDRSVSICGMSIDTDPTEAVIANNEPVFDPETWTDGPPQELFRRLRSECPVHWSSADGRAPRRGRLLVGDDGGGGPRSQHGLADLLVGDRRLHRGDQRRPAAAPQQRDVHRHGPAQARPAQAAVPARLHAEADRRA